MWSSTNQRIKALMSARQREKERLSRPIHVRRADLKLSFRTDDGFLVEIASRGLLNDFTPEGFSVYAVERLNSNVELSVEIDHPKHFRLTAKVVWCQYQPTSTHVLNAQGQQFPYRVGLAFIWKDAAIEAEFKKFCSELADLYVNHRGMFIEENFVSAAPTIEAEPAVAAVEVPAPTESDEGGAPSDEKVAEALAAEKAAMAADAVLAGANPVSTGAPPAETATDSASAILDALKDVDGSTPPAEKASA